MVISDRPARFGESNPEIKSTLPGISPTVLLRGLRNFDLIAAAIVVQRGERNT